MVDRWNYCLLSSVCEEITSGGAAPQGDKYFINGKYPFVRVVDMGNLHGQKYMLQTRDLLNDVGAEKLRLFPSGTILFTKSGASLLLNQRAILKVPMYVVSHIGCLIPNEAIISEWLYYWMKTVDFNIYAHATTLPSLKLTTIKELRIPVPTIPVQERIVARIEELFSQLDAGVETLKKTKAQLAVYRQAVLKEAFEGKYTPDVTMHEIKMGEIADGKDGLRRGPFGSAIKKAFFVESGYKVYEQGNAINNDCKRGHYYISADKYNELSSFQLRPGDFIVSCSGTIGKIAQLPADAEPGVINQALMRIRLKPDVIDPYYFMMQFRSEVFQRKIVSRGSGMGNLAGIKEFKLATMFIPENYENQKQIVAEIESRLSVCDSIEHTVDLALQQAEAMRQSILKDAFEGRL